MDLNDIPLDRGSGTPLHEQLATALRAAMEEGRLPTGSRLPASRDLARSLGVNRGTVQKAYAALVAAGEARAAVGQGTFVAGTGGLAVGILPPPQTAEDPDWERLARWSDRPGVISLAGGMPDARLFPVAPFRESLDAVLAEEGTGLLQYGPSRGHGRFLEVLASRLRERGLDRQAEQLLVVSGSQQGLDLVARVFISPGDAVVVEDPTYSGALALFRMMGARLLPVPVDDHGMVVEHLESLLTRERPRLVYTIPNFHNPTGVTMAPSRRKRLLEICAAAGVPVVEDDSDGELAFDDAPPEPLAAGAGKGGVIYLGTSSKLLFPGLRLGWVAADSQVIRTLEAVKRVADLHTPPLLQAAMANFMMTKACRALVTAVRASYGNRRDALLESLGEEMPAGVSWSKPRGGLSLMVDLPAHISTTDLLSRAVGEGVVFAPGNLFAARRGADHRLRLTYGGVREDEIREGMVRLGRAVRAELNGADQRRFTGKAISPPPLV
ncbi:MAG: PLP-dependent aminotransferase family protein [Acidobacteria bacterium]|nr:PLP-dependent aminotransferase family protein [Acidobacteriota bacterium]